MMRHMALMAAGLLLLAGCASDGGGDTPSPGAQTEAAQTLRDTCPEVEAALPKGLLPPPAKWETFAGELDELAAGGDTETQNALSASALQSAAEDLAADPSGSKLLAARDALRTGLDNLADRCKAAGSSALQ